MRWLTSVIPPLNDPPMWGRGACRRLRAAVAPAPRAASSGGAGPGDGGVALVTGGAGGIGSGICRRLAQEGMRVAVTYRSDPAKARELAGSLPGSGHTALFADTLDSQSLRAAAEELGRTLGRLDLLVNNAGCTTGVEHDDLDGLTDEWIDRIMSTNFRGSFACVRAFRRLLEDSGGGTVVNISSVAGVTGVGSNVAYCASKAAVDSMTRSLGRALAPRVRVLSVSPGWVPGEYAHKTVSPEFLQAQIDGTPLARLGTPDDVGLAVWAAHKHLVMATGTAIPVDGGRPLGPK